VKLIARSGFKKAYFGLEILQNKENDVLRKNDHASQVLSVLKLCAEKGIEVHLFCMFGFPGTGRLEAQKTIEFILAYQDIIDTVDISSWSYAKHTHVPQAKKIIQDSDDWALEYNYQYESEEGLVTKERVDAMVNELIDIVWDECPRLLHPTCRLVSPWISLSQDSLSMSNLGGKDLAVLTS